MKNKMIFTPPPLKKSISYRGLIFSSTLPNYSKELLNKEE